MEIEDFKKILDNIKGHTNYIYLHILGEPLMHPNLSKILDLASDYNLMVNITTNGRLLEKNIDSINNAKSIRQINISLHSFNDIEEIKLLLLTIDKIKIDSYISLRLWNLGSNNNNEEIIKLIKDHYNVNIDKIGENVRLKDKIYLDFDSEFKWPDINDEVRNNVGTCQGLRSQIGILVDGTVVPCCLDTDGIINLGNILKDNLNTILQSEKCKSIKNNFMNRKLVEPLCMRCQYITRFDKKNI
jgi:radical SAM protein with 4Fe4S-binding SPASM domain